MDYLHSPSDACLSDSDLEIGLPSPSESDDEQVRTSVNTGVVVPHFCNKLREQTRPLLCHNHGIPSPCKQLKENATDKTKESKAKKRLFKGKQQPSSGVIERRYGYIPNPRWPKSFSSYYRPYDPVGVGNNDRRSIPGVVFREKQKSKLDVCDSSCEHSYIESDFPMLHISGTERSQNSTTSAAVPHPHLLDNQCNTTVAVYQNELSLNSTNVISPFQICHESPSTSTPVKRGNIIYSSTQNPANESVDSSAYTSDSTNSTRSPVKSCVISDIVQNTSGKVSEKVSPISVVGRTSSFSPQAAGSDGSPSICNTKQDAPPLSRILNESSTWSDRLKQKGEMNSSSKHSLQPQNCSYSYSDSRTDTRQLSPVSDTSSQSESSLPSNNSQTLATVWDLTKHVAVSSSSTWSDVAKGLPSQKDHIVSSEASNSGLQNSQAEKIPVSSWHRSKPAELLNSADQLDQYELRRNLNDKRTSSRHRKFKTADTSYNNESTSVKYSSSDFSRGGSQSKLHSYSGGDFRNESNLPRTLTLENFITPQKNTRKKCGAPNGKKDLDLLQNRFVEQLAANPISPPKKVRPSPVKQLSFLKQVDPGSAVPEHAVTDSGDYTNCEPLNSGHKESHNLPNIINMSGDCATTVQVTTAQPKADTYESQTEVLDLIKHQGAPVFALEKSMKNADMKHKKDAFEEVENEDECPENDDSDSEAKVFLTPKPVNKRQLLQTRLQNSTTSASVPQPHLLDNQCNASVAVYQNELSLISTNVISPFRICHESPSTSTPVKRGNIIYSSTQSSANESVDSSAYTSDSTNSTRSPVKSCVISDIVQNTSGKVSKKVSPISVVGRTSSFSPQAAGSDGSPSVCNTKQDAPPLSRILNESSTWSDRLKQKDEMNNSSKHSLQTQNCSYSYSNSRTDTRQLSPVSDTSSQSESSLPSNNSQTLATVWDLTKHVAVSSSSTWSDVAKGLPSQKDNTVSPGASNSGLQNSQAEKIPVSSWHRSKPAELLNSADQLDQYELRRNPNDKRTSSRHRKFKTADSSYYNESTSVKYSSSDFNSGRSQSKLNSYSGDDFRNENNLPRTLTLENFITPQKNTRKKCGAPNGKKDLDLLQNRFVEQLAANAISPPKKVRPSPVKQLSFLKQVDPGSAVPEHAVADSGDYTICEPLNSGHREPHNLPNIINMSGDCVTPVQVTTAQPKADTYESQIEVLDSTKHQGTPVFSLEKSMKNADMKHKKDAFEEEAENEDECPENDDSDFEAKVFWTPKPVNKRQLPQTSGCKLNIPCESDEEDETDCIANATSLASTCSQSVLYAANDDIVDGVKQACLSKVTYKSVLRKYARRYCHYVEEHQVPNIAVELYFIIQLLTCSDVDTDLLSHFDNHGKETYFRSIHNGVYFAVIVIKRLKYLFLTLDKMYLELLIACPRIKAFSLKLHRFLVQAVKNKEREPVSPSPVEHIAFNPHEDGAMSFPDLNNAHVFKCQRDNFYAFYRHYHDTSSAYEFRIENQIQYVYDGCTPEQNSVVNLMHLAKLYVDHMILCCVEQTEEQVDVLKMIHSKGQDEQLFTSLYEAFLETSSTSSACPSPGFSERQMFFKDFIETLSCPAFNEHLRNLVVFRILQLNATDFSSVMNLHSAVIVPDDKTPLRAGKFTETVKTLCLLGKLLGYLTFYPYTSGAQNIAHDQIAELLVMREMSPVPVPLLLLLKQAFDQGQLCLTVPWVVEYLAMMDQMAPQLSLYRAVLRKLHFIQRYAWTALYKEGHFYSGLLVVSCISWLFEAPAVPGGLFFLYDDSKEISALTGCTHLCQIDRQKLVCQQLLSWCCPYLEQGQVLLTLFLLKQQTVAGERNILPVSETDCSRNIASTDKVKKEVAEIQKWLGTSFGQDTENCVSTRHGVIDDEVVPAYVLTHLLARKESDELEDMEAHLVENSPYLKASIDTAVDLLCAKLTDYTNKIILKLLMFEAKTEVRTLFQGASAGTESETVKDRILAEASLRANKYSKKAKESFYALCERSFGKELTDLLMFLASNASDEMRQSVIHIAKKLVTRRLQEWSDIQLGPVHFRRVLVGEAEKCAKTTRKYLPLYPNDHSKKLEELTSPELIPGFTEHEQLSELITKALSYGVWYINALSPGVRPDDVHMLELIEDFTKCIEKKMITMDFAFTVMANLLMHLIIQYIVDAPQNWTKQAEDAFIRLCCLCKERKIENDKTVARMSDTKKKKSLMVKVQNFLSVFCVQWLAKSENQLKTLMAYCKLIYRLMMAQLLYVETVYRKLTSSRENRNLDAQTKILVNRVLIKLLEMLYESQAVDMASCSPETVLRLLEDFIIPLKTVPEVQWDEVLTDMAVHVQSTFGHVLGLSYQRS